MQKIVGRVVLLMLLLSCVGCGKSEVQYEEPQAQQVPVTMEIRTATTAPQSNEKAETAVADEVMIYLEAAGTTLQERIKTPKGYQRIKQEAGSFGAFIRDYPMLPDGNPVLLWDGREKGNQRAHAAVFDMEVLNEIDVQQCADSVMRMYAEYLWNTGKKEKIGFHFVDGFLFDYPTFREGNRAKFDGGKTRWSKTASYDDSYETFAKKYLLVSFAYSSTLSMGEESVTQDIKELTVGDVFLKSGSPGHVVMVADICENQDGKRAFLLAQGYMPAQQFHVLWNPQQEGDPWYYVEDVSYPFETPEYTFQEGSLRHMKYLD